MLKSHHDAPVIFPYGIVVPWLGVCQTIDQRVSQVLFQGPDDFSMSKDFRLCFGKMAGLRVQAEQLRRDGAGRPQYLAH